MATEEIERLNYYQGQYLGAEDFKTEQAYHRDMRRRHNIAHHTWGIVTGLELVERTEDGVQGVVVYLQPGVAVDGYGREIIVAEPTRLDAADFNRFNNQQPAHYQVWIGYEEEEAERPRFGYEICGEEDQFQRARETFRLRIEPDPPHDDGIVVGGRAVTPPPLPPETPDANTFYVQPDRSVPFQELPEGPPPPRWLVRLGSVNWDAQTQTFQPAAVQDGVSRLKEGRLYVGVVAAELLAPARKLLVRDRATARLPAGTEAQGDDTSVGVLATVEGALRVERLLTARGDVQIHQRKLDFRDANGDKGGVDFHIRRADSGGGGGKDLQIKIGDASAGQNRLAVRSGAADKLTVADNGDTVIDGNVTIRNAKNLTVEGGRIDIKKGSGDPAEWGIKSSGENLQFTEPDDSDRVVFEILDVTGDLTQPVIRLHDEANATLSAQQLIDLTNGGITSLHTHVSASTTQRGMVEIAESNETGTNGGSGARLVIAANDPRMLTQTQKNELTDGGMTNLHHHPNGFLNNVQSVDLAVGNGLPSTSTLEIFLGSNKRIVAMVFLSTVNPTTDLDDGLAADIFKINGARPPTAYTFNNAEYGTDGSDANLMSSFFSGVANRVTFRLRTFDSDQFARASGVVFFEDV